MTEETPRIYNVAMTFKQIISLWPNMAELARDLDEPHVNVKMWKLRDSIPSAYWPGLIAAAKKRKLNVTLDDLFAAQQRRFAA